MAPKRDGKTEVKSIKYKIISKNKTENMNLKVMLKALLDLKMSEVVTDKATLIYDAETLAEGVEVFVQDPENADKVMPAEDGEYTIEEEKKIVVVKEGKVAEVNEIEEEKTEETETEVKEEEVEVKAEELPAEEPIEEEVTEETETDKRITEMLDTITELTNRLATLEGKITEMEERISKVEGEPAAEPIEDENKPAEEEVKASRLSYLKKK